MSQAEGTGGGGERALRALERGATALGVSVARSLYGRWRRMPAERRTQLERLAEGVKERALEARGEPDERTAASDLRAANERFADAIVESARADPDVSDTEVRDLRADLARELDRLADADIRASRGPGRIAS